MLPYDHLQKGLLLGPQMDSSNSSSSTYTANFPAPIASNISPQIPTFYIGSYLFVSTVPIRNDTEFGSICHIQDGRPPSANRPACPPRPTRLLAKFPQQFGAF
uniref:Uncharacterized protein n=1 Tax=Globodera rostochiensis TaxID=31243 RepID=A0A914IGU8_GLORO